MVETALSELLHWITEREAIRIQKDVLGSPKPWTKDPILRDYKFCNVRRNDDRVSIWIQENWMNMFSTHKNLAFAMCVARIFNWPDTLHAIQDEIFSESPDLNKVRDKLKCRRDVGGHKIFTGAYTVSTCGLSMDKIDYVCDVVFKPLLSTIKNPVVGQSLEEYWNYLQQFQGFSSFMAGQVIADLKYTHPLIAAADWNTFAPLGPGSTRGLNRLYGRPLGGTIKQQQGTRELLDIQKIVNSRLGEDIALHDIQNCMCEFDKYMRLKYDGGKVRSKYDGRG
jgi:hypothetical protein